MHGNAWRWYRIGMAKITTANRPQTTRPAQTPVMTMSFVAVLGRLAGQLPFHRSRQDPLAGPFPVFRNVYYCSGFRVARIK